MKNLALYLLSFEYESQNSLIDMLIEPRSSEKYFSGPNYGKYRPLISDANVELLERYRKLCETLKAKPSLELLKKEFETLSFDNLKPLDQEHLIETIKLDISELQKTVYSNELIKLSSKVRNEGMVDEVRDKLSSLGSLSSEDKEYSDMFENIEDIYKKTSVIKGIKTGIEQVDEKTGGFQPGTFNTIAGFAGAGKTTAAVNVCYNALKEGKNVCYITLEVPKLDLCIDFLSRHSFDSKFTTTISHSIIKKRELNESDSKYLFEKVIPDFNKELKKHLFILDETDFTDYNFRSLEDRIRECNSRSEKVNESGIDLLVIDQAQLLKFGGGINNAGNETSVINLYVSFFRQQAINFLHSKRPCTVVMLSQINRDGYNYACKHEGRYTLTNLAEANELERASAMVIAIFSDESLKGSKQASIQLLKSRNGETIVDPVLTYMDPVYYVFGSSGISSTTKTYNSSDITGLLNFGSDEPLDLNNINQENTETKLEEPVSVEGFDSIL